MEKNVHALCRFIAMLQDRASQIRRVRKIALRGLAACATARRDFAHAVGPRTARLPTLIWGLWSNGRGRIGSACESLLSGGARSHAGAPPRLRGAGTGFRRMQITAS